jgi:phosphotransferase system enzyme I (PtsI)
VKEVQTELEALHLAMTGGDVPSEFGAFLDVHWMILTDPTLSETPKKIILDQRCNAEWALTTQLQVLVDQFEQIEDEYLRERKSDIVQVGERVLKRLMGKPGALPAPVAEEQTILVAHDLSPADVIQFKHHRYGAFLTDVGGVTSHTAIVARSLNVPAVVATHNARQLIRDSEMLIVDGESGVVIVNPDRAVLAEYRLKQSELELERQKLKRLRLKPAETIDGHHVRLNQCRTWSRRSRTARPSASSAEFCSSIAWTAHRGRQFEAYRTWPRDERAAGDDPRSTWAPTRTSRGSTASRASQSRAGPARSALYRGPRLFLTQLRAILRASHYGRVRILVPMLASSGEIDQTLQMIEMAKESLREQGVPFDSQVEVGGMIEIPAAVIAMDAFVAKLDFLSIGTNDLIQYTLAVDRRRGVAHLYNPCTRRSSAPRAGHHHTTRRRSHCGGGEMAGEVALPPVLGPACALMHLAHLLGVKQRVLTRTRGCAHRRAHPARDSPDRISPWSISSTRCDAGLGPVPFAQCPHFALVHNAIVMRRALLTAARVAAPPSTH